MKKFVLLLMLTPFLGKAQTPPADHTFYNKGADITIQPGALVHVQGAFTNGDNTVTTAAVHNDGIIEVKGDLYNDHGGTFDTTAGVSGTNKVVKFIGSGTQQIIGNFSDNTTAYLKNVVIDKAAATDKVLMTSDLYLKGSLVFGSGTTASYSPSAPWTVNNNKGLLQSFSDVSDPNQQFVLDVQSGNLDAISGYSALGINTAATTGYIITQGTKGNVKGGVQRNVAGNFDYVYPIGTTNHGYNGITMHFMQTPTGAKTVVGKFCDADGTNGGYVGTIHQECHGCALSGPYSTPDNNGYNRYFAAGDAPCNPNAQWVILEKAVSNHGYWSFGNNNPANQSQYVYSVEAYPNSFTDNGQPTDTWRLLKYHDGASNSSDYGFDPSSSDWTSQIESSINLGDMTDLVTYTRNAGCYSGNGVPGGRYKGFSHFGMAKSQSNNALPVTLIDLRADAIDNSFIKVSWVTAVEINNAGFSVMRSTDGVNFTYQGFVQGHNNSTVTQNYAFDDHNVEANVVYYYKLVQQDNDGHTQETDIVSAMITQGQVFAISDFTPNPAQDYSKIIITTSNEMPIEVKLYDLLGREMSTRSYNLSVGQNTITFDVATIADATYTAVITAANKVYSKKLVLARY